MESPQSKCVIFHFKHTLIISKEDKIREDILASLITTLVGNDFYQGPYVAYDWFCYFEA